MKERPILFSGAMDKKLDRIKSEASDKGHFFVLLFLIILVLRGC